MEYDATQGESPVADDIAAAMIALLLYLEEMQTDPGPTPVRADRWRQAGKLEAQRLPVSRERLAAKWGWTVDVSQGIHSQPR